MFTLSWGLCSNLSSKPVEMCMWQNVCIGNQRQVAPTGSLGSSVGRAVDCSSKQYIHRSLVRFRSERKTSLPFFCFQSSLWRKRNYWFEGTMMPTDVIWNHKVVEACAAFCTWIGYVVCGCLAGPAQGLDPSTNMISSEAKEHWGDCVMIILVFNAISGLHIPFEKWSN